MRKAKCIRCGHGWYRRQPGRPRICPKCKSAYWNTPKRYKSRGKREVRVNGDRSEVDGRHREIYREIDLLKKSMKE